MRPCQGRDTGPTPVTRSAKFSPDGGTQAIPAGSHTLHFPFATMVCERSHPNANATMKKILLFAAVFAAAFVAAALFIAQSNVHAQLYNNNTSNNATSAGGTNTTTGMNTSGSPTSSPTGGNSTGTRTNTRTPGLPNTGGGGARYIK